SGVRHPGGVGAALAEHPTVQAAPAAVATEAADGDDEDDHEQGTTGSASRHAARYLEPTARLAPEAATPAAGSSSIGKPARVQACLRVEPHRVDLLGVRRWGLYPAGSVD